ncbi:MAG: aldehyde ferredoxin oxidoreductase C-terminal domain-containing protein [Candidatus Zixiibacteriota bacterium]
MVKYEEALGKFYKLIGWDENGVRAKARLKRLDLEDVADKMG